MSCQFRRSWMPVEGNGGRRLRNPGLCLASLGRTAKCVVSVDGSLKLAPQMAKRKSGSKKPVTAPQIDRLMEQSVYEAVGEMSDEQRKVLLFFWTSVKYLPVEGFHGLSSRLCIYKSLESCDHLPSSHTCFFRLCIPPYPSKDMMRERLEVITKEHVGCSFGTCFGTLCIEVIQGAISKVAVSAVKRGKTTPLPASDVPRRSVG